MNRTVKLTGLAALYLSGILLLFLTNPQRSHISLLVVPFVIFFLSLFFTIRLLLSYFVVTNRRLSSHKKTWFAGLAAAFPTLVIVLQSIGQFTLRDLITLVVLFGVLSFYVSRLPAA